MSLVFEPFSAPMALHICQNMRDLDVDEIFATRYDDCAPWALFHDLQAAAPGCAWFEIARPETSTLPIALFGVSPQSPGTGAAFLIGTRQLRLAHARQIAARIREVIIPALLRAGLHRVEAHSLASYRWAHRFMRSAGAQSEGIRHNMGKAGEDFETFVWLKPPALRRLDGADPACANCAGTGWVCENHPDRSWPQMCDCGAGMPCRCNPISKTVQQEKADA